jgi:N-acetylglucosamine-6-phosphate deacetylase
MRLGVARAVTEDGIVDGDVEIEDGRIVAVGVTPAGVAGIAAPGFVDIQVNGFAGVDFAAADVADYETTGPALAATGVTAYQPTLITLPEETARQALATLNRVDRDKAAPRLIGMHLEGPFLSPDRYGAHEPGLLVAPDPALLERLLASGPVSMVTLAPELPGALDLIDLLVGRGVAVACGHSDATAATANAAFERGATVVTHLFNAQRPFHHRDPGIAGAALVRSDVTVSIIADRIHLADEAMRLTFAAPAPVALITDAIAAAGRPDGSYPLGNRTVTVTHGEARLVDGTLAGSVLTMDAAVRNVVDIGIDLADAIAAATAVPAAAVGRHDLGSLRPGAQADVIVLDDELHVTRTLVGGDTTFPPS